MKRLFTIVVLLVSVKSFASDKELLCQQLQGQTQGAFGITLGKSNLDQNSNYYLIQGSSWAFAYSSAQLVCSKKLINITGTESFKCIGYNSAGGKTEVLVNLDSDAGGTARVHNIGNNIYARETEGMTLPCQIKED